MEWTSRWPWAAAVAVGAAAIATTLAADSGSQQRGDDGRRGDEGRATYAIGAWGDLPYSDLQAQVGVPNLIADMNRQDLEFTVHDGDLKAGNSTPGSVTPTNCSDELYAQALRYFTMLRAPVVFTPGDNDWTDCDRPSNGPFSSLERLDERQVFFSTPLFTRPAADAAAGSGRRALPGRERHGAVRREPPLAHSRRDVRDFQHPGLLQQPVRHRA